MPATLFSQSPVPPSRPFTLTCNLTNQGDTCGPWSVYQIKLLPQAPFYWPPSAPLTASHRIEPEGTSTALVMEPQQWQQAQGQKQQDGHILWTSQLTCPTPQAIPANSAITTTLRFFLCDTTMCQRYQQQIRCALPPPPS